MYITAQFYKNVQSLWILEVGVWSMQNYSDNRKRKGKGGGGKLGHLIEIVMFTHTLMNK